VQKEQVAEYVPVRWNSRLWRCKGSDVTAAVGKQRDKARVLIKQGLADFTAGNMPSTKGEKVAFHPIQSTVAGVKQQESVTL